MRGGWWAAVLVAAAAGCGHTCWCKPAHKDAARAGHPAEVSACAVPSDTGRYVGYAVGGGAACKGDGPGCDEGTWGWDYGGLGVPAKVDLGWWHGRRAQGGTGDYRTDGPRVVERLERKKEGGEP